MAIYKFCSFSTQIVNIIGLFISKFFKNEIEKTPIYGITNKNSEGYKNTMIILTY